MNTSKPKAPTIGLDHVGFIIPDLAQSHALFNHLGFILTTRADHTRTNPQGQVVSAGSSQHSIMLKSGYIELMQITDPLAGHQLTPALEVRYGLHVLALATPDAGAWHADCLQRQLRVGPLLDWSRPVKTPECEGLARFCFFDAPWQAEDPSYICWVQHLTPELVRSPSLLEHPNQAQALLGVTYGGPLDGLQGWGQRLQAAGATPPNDGSNLGLWRLTDAGLTLNVDPNIQTVHPMVLTMSFDNLNVIVQRAQALGLPCQALQGMETGCRIDLRQSCGIYLDALVSGSSA